VRLPTAKIAPQDTQAQEARLRAMLATSSGQTKPSRHSRGTGLFALDVSCRSPPGWGAGQLSHPSQSWQDLRVASRLPLWLADGAMHAFGRSAMDALNPRPADRRKSGASRRREAAAKARVESTPAWQPLQAPGAVEHGEATRILVVDAEAEVRSGLRGGLAAQGFAVSEAADGAAALAELRRQGADVVLADTCLSGVDGVTLVRSARQEGLPVLFVMMTDAAGVEAAVEAMRAGAENFLIKPFEFGTLQVVLDKVLEKRRLAREAEQLRDRIRERYRLDSIVGESTALQAVFDVVRRAASTETAILLLGEAGTGKELVAQAIHQSAPRRDAPFLKVRCVGLSEALLESALFGNEASPGGAVGPREGRFELANRGTLFLDEIGELPASLQIKLLRVLQEGEFERAGGTRTHKVDVRVVAASHHDLAAEVAAGRFREDLYLCLNSVAVTLPPLRSRKADIPLLVSHFIQKFNQAHGKSVRGLLPGILNDLLRYDWPGNVRELENVIERAVVLSRGQYLSPEELPPALSRPGTASPCPGVLAGATLRDIEREAILRTLQAVEGSTPLAAAMLGISPRKIQYRLKEYAGAGLAGGVPAPDRAVRGGKVSVSREAPGPEGPRENIST